MCIYLSILCALTALHFVCIPALLSHLIALHSIRLSKQNQQTHEPVNLPELKPKKFSILREDSVGGEGSMTTRKR